MSELIKSNDLIVIEEIATRYGMSIAEFGKLITNQTRKKTTRQIRVSDEEFENIITKAKEKNLSVDGYCELACRRFISNMELKEDFFVGRSYGKKRDKRITIKFKDESLENNILNAANNFNVDVGSLIRYCVIKF